MLVQELGLIAKQEKKVYALYLQQAQRMTQKTTGASRPGGNMGDRGPGGGMYGRGMGGPGGGMHNRGMHAPGADMHPAEKPAGEDAVRKSSPARIEESDEEIATRNKKMKKILTPEQYGKWARWESEDQYRQMRNMWDEELKRTQPGEGNMKEENPRPSQRQ